MITRPLDPLDENICRHCTLLIVLLADVGWLHGMSAVNVECLTPEPSCWRCVTCSMLLPRVRFGRFAGLISAHGSSHGSVCPGTHRHGLPPLPLSAAFRA